MAVPFLAAVAGRHGFSVTPSRWNRYQRGRDYYTLRHASSRIPLAGGTIGFLMRHWPELQRLARVPA